MSAEHPPATLPAITANLADFPALAHLSDLSDLALSPSEAHGIFCGLLCSGEAESLTRWLDEILPSTATAGTDSAACRAALTQLACQTQAAIESPRRGFAPLLPETEAPLCERAEAVNDWSRGFLFGLGLNGCDPNTFSGATREAIDDLTELTRIDLNGLEDNEDNEQALEEISEFLWVAAMLVYEDRSRAKPH